MNEMKMSKEAFVDWMGLAETEAFFNYLKDSIKEESGLVANRICNGGMITEQEIIVQSTTCVALLRISEIDYEEIDDFYKQEE